MICKKCNKEKEEIDYSLYKSRGVVYRRGTCKKCYQANVALWYRNNPDRAIEIDKKAMAKHYRANRESILESCKARQKAHPEKGRAKKRVSDAIKAKKMSGPDACSLCNKGRTIVAHHPDYTKPLYVIWVCKSCHTKLHPKKAVS